MPVDVPGRDAVAANEYEKRVCAIRSNLETARNVAEAQGGKAARQEFENIKRTARDLLEAAQRDYEESFVRNNSGLGETGTFRRSVNALRQKLIRDYANNKIGIVDYTRRIIRGDKDGGLGDKRDAVDLHMAMDQSVGQSAEHDLSTKEIILDPMFPKLVELARDMGLVDRDLGGRKQTSAEQAMIVSDFWIRMKDELDGTNETQAMRYNIPLNGDGNRLRAEAIVDYLTNHKDPDKLNRNLDRFIAAYGTARPYDRQWDPGELAYLREQWQPWAKQLDAIADDVHKLRVRSLELGRKSRRIGDEDMLLIKAYGLNNYLPNKGADHAWADSRDLQMAQFVQDPAKGSIALSYETLPIKQRRSEWGANGIVQLIADVNRGAFDIGDRQITQRLKNIANDYGARGRVEKIGRFKKYWNNPKDGRREVHPKLREVLSVNSQSEQRDDGIFFHQEGDYVTVMKVLDSRLATDIRTNQQRSLVDQVYRPLGSNGLLGGFNYIGRIQGKMLTTYNPEFYLRDYQRNFGNAVAKMGNLHGYREIATFMANQPRFLASAIKQAFGGGFDRSKTGEPDSLFEEIQRRMRNEGFHTERTQSFGRFGANENVLDTVTALQSPLRGRGRRLGDALDKFWGTLASVPEQAVRVGYVHAVDTHAGRRRESRGDEAATSQRAMFEAQNLTNFKLQGEKEVHGFEAFLKPSVNAALDTIDYWKNGRNRLPMAAATIGWGAFKFKMLLMLHEVLFGDEGVERFLDTPDETNVRGLPIFIKSPDGKLTDEAFMIEHHYGGGMLTWLGGHIIKTQEREARGMPVDLSELGGTNGLIARSLATHWSPVDAEIFQSRTMHESVLQLLLPVALEPAFEATRFGANEPDTPGFQQISRGTNELWIDAAREAQTLFRVDVAPEQLDTMFRTVHAAKRGVEMVYDALEASSDEIDRSILRTIPGINLSSRRVGRDVLEDFYRNRRKLANTEKRMRQGVIEYEAGDVDYFHDLNEAAGGDLASRIDRMKGYTLEIDRIDSQLQQLQVQRSFRDDDPRRRTPREISAQAGGLQEDMFALVHQYNLLARRLP